MVYTLRSFLCAGLLLLPLAVAAPAAHAATPEAQLLDELNFARTHPQDYARRLELEPVSPWERALAEPTDRAALAEAIAFLRRQAPLPALGPDEGLAEAAREHVTSQGPRGRTGHDGPDGEPFDARLRRHGVDAPAEGENIAYGPTRPADVVRELIIDSGVASRGHRRNIFTAGFEAAGVTCGPHRDYGTMCVIDFVGGPRAGSPPATTQTAALAASPGEGDGRPGFGAN
jgi:uncharacterized protein YkwD